MVMKSGQRLQGLTIIHQVGASRAGKTVGILGSCGMHWPILGGFPVSPLGKPMSRPQAFFVLYLLPPQAVVEQILEEPILSVTSVPVFFPADYENLAVFCGMDKHRFFPS